MQINSTRFRLFIVFFILGIFSLEIKVNGQTISQCQNTDFYGIVRAHWHSATAPIDIVKIQHSQTGPVNIVVSALYFQTGIE